MNRSSRSSLIYVSFLAVGIGILSGIVAYFLYHLIGLFTNIAFFQRFSGAFANPHDRSLGLWVIGIPVIGGLIVGLMAKYGSEKIKGHGIPEAMEAVVANRSKIEPKVALLKPLSAAIAIGTGGPFGAEGPIIQTGGALGSLIGQLLHTTTTERKILLACGAGAGMAATFNTPVAGVILAIELLLFEFRSRSFIPLVISVTAATAIRWILIGTQSMFNVADLNFDLLHLWPYYLLLGVLCGLAAVAFTRSLYWMEDFFDRLRVHEVLKPAIGALALGVIGYFVPRVFGVGYDTISDILNDKLALGILLTVMFAKSIALIISLGSETSGGLLAPMFMASSALGGAFAIILNHFFPSIHLPPAAFALAAMGAVFGPASQATFALIIFSFEITRNYNAILPLMLTAVVADGVALSFLRNSIMTEKLARRGTLIPRDYEADVLQQISVGEVMQKGEKVLPIDMKLSELLERIGKGDSGIIRHQAFPIVDKEGNLAGIITKGDIVRALSENLPKDASILSVGSSTPLVAYPDESLDAAVARMIEADVGRLLVVSRENPAKLIGYLGKSAILSARSRKIHEESIREPGLWSGKWWRREGKKAKEGNLSP